MKSKKTKVLVIILCLTMVYMSTVYAATGFSDAITETKSVFSLPPNTSNGLISDIIVKGNTRTNIFGDNGDFESIGYWSNQNSNNTDEITIKLFGTKARKQTTTTTTNYFGAYKLGITVDTDKWYCVSVYINKNKDTATEIHVTNATCKKINTTETGSFQRIQTRFKPTSTSVDIYIREWGVTDAYMILDGALLEEITQSEYDASSYTPQNFINGVKSTNCGILRSESHNRFNKDDIEQGGFDANGNEAVASTRVRDKNYRRVKASTSYTVNETISVDGSLLKLSLVNYYDVNKSFINQAVYDAVSLPQTFTTPANAVYNKNSYRFISNDAVTPADFENADFIIAEGSGTPIFTEYEFSEVFCPVELYNTPANKPCTFNFKTGLHTANNKKYVLQASDITAVTDFTNNQLIDIVLSDSAFNGTDNNQALMLSDGYYLTSPSNYDTSGYDKGYYTTTGSAPEGRIRIIRTLGTYANLAAAQADLAGTSVIYQLATPQTTTYNTTPLACYKNGTIMVLPQVKESSAYNNGMSITNTSLPIKSLIRVDKIENGVLTPVDLSNVTIAPDELSFTIPGAVNGETYIYVYEYASELSTIPTITYSVPINQDGQITGNTNALQRHSDLIDIILQQIQLMRQEIQELKTMLE